MITLELLRSVLAKVDQEKKQQFLNEDFFVQVVQEIANQIMLSPQQTKLEIYRWLKKLILSGKGDDIYEDFDLASVFLNEDFERFYIDEEKYLLEPEIITKMQVDEVLSEGDVVEIPSDSARISSEIAGKLAEKHEIVTKMQVNNILSDGDNVVEMPATFTATPPVITRKLAQQQKTITMMQVNNFLSDGDNGVELPENFTAISPVIARKLTLEKVFKAVCQVILNKNNKIKFNRSEVCIAIRPEYKKYRSSRKRLPEDMNEFNKELAEKLNQLVDAGFLKSENKSFSINLKCDEESLRKIKFSEETTNLYQKVQNKFKREKMPPMASLVSRFTLDLSGNNKRPRGDANSMLPDEPPKSPRNC